MRPRSVPGTTEEKVLRCNMKLLARGRLKKKEMIVRSFWAQGLMFSEHWACGIIL